jgi:DnaJ-class molecular chaperone
MANGIHNKRKLKERKQSRPPAPSLRAIPCPTCVGDGYYNGGTCPQCKGRKEILVAG